MGGVFASVFFPSRLEAIAILCWASAPKCANGDGEQTLLGVPKVHERQGATSTLTLKIGPLDLPLKKVGDDIPKAALLERTGFPVKLTNHSRQEQMWWCLLPLP